MTTLEIAAARRQVGHGRMFVVVNHDGAAQQIAKQHRLDREEADHHRGDGQQHQRQRDDPRRLVRHMLGSMMVVRAGFIVGIMAMVRVGVLIEALFAVKDKEIQAEQDQVQLLVLEMVEQEAVELLL